MPPCSARPMAERTGRNSRAYAATGTALNGSPVRAACACTPSSSIPLIPIASSWRFGGRRLRTDDGGKSWKPINRGLDSQYIPDPRAEIGHCVHHVAMNPKRPGVLFMQKHWDVMRSDDAGDSWHEISGNLPTDFGFVMERPRSRAGDHLRRADHQRLASLRDGRQTPSLFAAAAAATNGSR